jgi:uncharacterized protein (DUF4415 family)
VRTLQVPETQTGALAADKGAIAASADKLAAAQASGIPAGDRSSYWVATAQATASLAWDPNATPTVKVKGPKGGFVKAGDKATYSIRGVAAGEQVCVTTPNGTQALTGTGGNLSVELKTKRRADKAFEVSATTGPGEATATTTPLPRKTLKSVFKKRVKRGATVSVTLKKLQPKEKVQLKIDNRVVRKGKADAKGQLVVKFRAPARLGKHKLIAQGAFPNRKVGAKFTVIR